MLAVAAVLAVAGGAWFVWPHGQTAAAAPFTDEVRCLSVDNTDRVPVSVTVTNTLAHRLRIRPHVVIVVRSGHRRVSLQLDAPLVTLPAGGSDTWHARTNAVPTVGGAHAEVRSCTVWFDTPGTRQ